MAWSHAQDNPTAEDLLDHWNEPEILRSALGLSPVSQPDFAVRKRSLKALLDAVGGSGNAGVRFRNVRPEDFEIIGEKNGITYGKWTGGPAGTLNIEFYWKFAPEIDATTRALMERAGKAWSHRLRDELDVHTVVKGTTVRDYTTARTFQEDVSTNGLLIAVWTDSSIPWSSAGAKTTVVSEDDFEPRTGGDTSISCSFRLAAYNGPRNRACTGHYESHERTPESHRIRRLEDRDSKLGALRRRRYQYVRRSSGDQSQWRSAGPFHVAS